MSAHGDNAREFTYMVEAGMSPLDAIKSATLGSAELLGLSSEVGTIEAGKAADPDCHRPQPSARHPRNCRRVNFVMREGQVFRGE